MFTSGSNEKRLFVQTFFLKDDGKRSPRRNFFVFNDVFRFIDREHEIPPPKVETPLLQKTKVTPVQDEQVKPQDKLALEEETQEQIVNNSELVYHVSNEEPFISKTQEVEEESKDIEPSSDAGDNDVDTNYEASAEPIAEQEPEAEAELDIVEENPVEKEVILVQSQVPAPPQKPKLPGSWASLVAGSSSKVSSAPAEVPPPSLVSKPPPKKDKDSSSVASSTAERPKKPPRPQEAETEPTVTGSVPTRATGYGSKGSSSLYIKNVGEGTTESDLKNLFSEYLFKIVNVSFYPSRGYAFVDFADPNAVNSIMKESRQTFHINGRAIEVEKKSSDRRRGSSGPTGGTVRGGNGAGGGNQRSSPKDQRQRSHSGRRATGGDGDRRGRRGGRGPGGGGKSGGGDKRRAAHDGSSGGASGNTSG